MTEEDLAEQVQDALASAHRQAARARRAAVEIAELRGSGRSPGGEVTAAVDHRGLVQDVTLASAAMRLDAAGLRTAVLATIAEAGADLRVQAAEATRGLDIDPRLPADQTEAFDLADRLLRGPP
ncbi:YbaB/EbfC DNA-binding family protein [Sanguibacter gelidistatuariae]|uniref:YbaB/EbfC DNA-binding family protein n=1 Tax=Sanguibacter gelidistatuariae TaxID=1814289 RepID=A0A1G6GSW2_9MICO|nr:YbaB/EbfC family nucleoid-associated protein [Sanguibacter gelidistatuariae]SDB84963.1 YbaB/EbfC DNA-binding family protein [Sanguibacter gelidistatuariae]